MLGSIIDFMLAVVQIVILLFMAGMSLIFIFGFLGLALGKKSPGLFPKAKKD